MIIKEYRVPLPLGLEEYKLAQRYMIAKKSLEDSLNGRGSVEILKNEPYSDGPGGSGIYTKKLYNIECHMPGWIKSIFPKNAFLIYEDSWNAYPYTMTRYSIPYIDKFNLEIETIIAPDNGQTENIFKLSPSELKKREVDFVNIIETPYEGKPEENPTVYVSKVTGRGPLKDGWEKTANPVICAYKICKVEFKYWGLQAKIENFICDVGLRKNIMSAHRGAWAWQDEWKPMSQSDIVKMEDDVARRLGQAMLAAVEAEVKANAGARVSIEPLAAAALTVPEETDENIRKMRKRANSRVSNISEDVFWDAEDIADISVDDLIVSIPEGVEEVPSGAAGKKHLLLAFYAPSLLEDEDYDLKSDHSTLMHTIFHVMNLQYQFAREQLAVVPVFCPPLISKNAIKLLCDATRRSDPSCLTLETIIMASFGGSLYDDAVKRVLQLAIGAYNTYVAENPDFEGPVSVLGDRVASVALMDLLSKHKASLPFAPTNFFALGSPMGLVLAQRQLMFPQLSDQSSTTPDDITPELACSQVFNIFQSADPVASRIEPHFDRRFAMVSPLNIPEFFDNPYGFGEDLSIWRAIDRNEAIFPDLAAGSKNADSKSQNGDARQKPQYLRSSSRDSGKSANTNALQVTPSETTLSIATDNQLTAFDKWWGTLRLDHQLPSPTALQNAAPVALLYATQGSYLQSRELAAFVLRHLVKMPDLSPVPARRGMLRELEIEEEFVRWNKKRSSLVVAGAKPVHKARDVVVPVGKKQVLRAKFAYGLAKATLAGEDVDIYLMAQPPNGEWVKVGSTKSRDNGKVEFEVPQQMAVGHGIYPVTFLVKGDHSTAESQLFVVRPKTEAVVFNIDAAFAASMSITGSDPKLQARAVDIAREWANKDYLLVYLTARPDIQQANITRWLARHNFPLGCLHFTGLMDTKSGYLKGLVEETEIVVRAAYGSPKDVAIFASAEISADNIYILGKGKDAAKYLPSGYTQEHLDEIKQKPQANIGLPAVDTVLTKRTLRNSRSNISLTGNRLSSTNVEETGGDKDKEKEKNRWSLSSSIKSVKKAVSGSS
eukprot:comp11663_c0_seq1/m.6180 comp11663_c0_seq1/g.6180  ORF comp11663_c0_seq1/g.6180 comp11663_c0_seq1/m.6180 type:complete len:1057 (-) comp11663_c0_seq1:305-3475(-)